MTDGPRRSGTMHDALDGLSPLQAIMAGREAEGVDLSVEAWNERVCAMSA